MFILDKEIKRIVNDEKEYRYGRFLDMNTMIERMTISLDHQNACYRINARILDGFQKQMISLKITQEGMIIYHHCSCSLDKSDSSCRHVGSLLFFLKNLIITKFPYIYEKNREIDPNVKFQLLEQERQNRILRQKQNTSLELIELYKERLMREAQIPHVSHQYQLKVIVTQEQDYFMMSLKIITSLKSYQIKNIQSFLHAINHHENYKYSKTFEFVHSLDAFDDNSQDILTFIEHYYQHHQLNNQGHMKQLMIDSSLLDEFFDLMSSLPSLYCDIGFQEKKNMIPLEINKKANYYILDLREYQDFENVMFSKHYIYQFSNDMLTRYLFDKQDQCLIFLQKVLESSDGLYIAEESLHDFYKYVLIDLLDYIDLQTHIFDQYHQENSIHLYVDMTSQEQIYLQLEYIYDQEISYGFDKNNPYLSKEALLIENYLESYIEDRDGHYIYLKHDHEFTYMFIQEGLTYLSHYCQIYVSDAIQGLSHQKEMKIQVGVQISQNLLEVNIESIHIDQSELYDILKAYKKKRKFYKLKDGQLISLQNQELRELDQLMTTLQIDMRNMNNGLLEVPTYRLFEIEQLSHQQDYIQYQRSQQFEDYLQHFQQPEDFPIPQKYENVLRQYQKEGYQWLKLMEHYGFSGVLADDMGLGKTLQMIVYLESIQHFQQPSLVITPASLLLNWQDEIQKFSSSLHVLCIYGQKDKRMQDIEKIDQYDVVLTSYDYLRRDIEYYEKLSFHTLVLDEAQYIKNPKTRNALCVKQLHAKQRFALTGTPIENSLAELWSIFDFLMPHYLFQYAYFLKHYERPIVKDHDEKKQEKLKQMVSPFILRRNKKDVLKELPDKIEKTMYFSFDHEEEKRYLSALVQVNKTLQEKYDIQQLGHIDILAMLTRLRQLCQDSRLLDPTIENPSSKLKGCMELIHALKENKQKILLFSSFTSVLHLIQEQCDKEHISYYLLEGSTPKEKRKAMIDAFQNDQTDIFLISLKAGGSGLNLTSAQAVIHFDPWWNMSMKNQATDRAHRIGQTQHVQVFSLIMKNTIEEKMMELQNQKKNLADTFVENQDISLSSMSIEDIQSLFQINESKE